MVAALREAEAHEAKVASSFQARRDKWIVDAREAIETGDAGWEIQEAYRETAVHGSNGTLATSEDGVLFFDGKGSESASYLLRMRPENTRAISAIRLEALPHESFGKPRQLARSVNGNFVLTDFSVSVVDLDSEESRALKIADTSASFEQKGYPIGNAIDGNRKSGWAVFAQEGAKPVDAYFFLQDAVDLSGDECLEIKLAHDSGFENHNIGRFRLSVGFGEEIKGRVSPPADVVAALAIPTSKRSGAQNDALTKHFRSIECAYANGREKSCPGEEGRGGSRWPPGFRDGNARKGW